MPHEERNATDFLDRTAAVASPIILEEVQQAQHVTVMLGSLLIAVRKFPSVDMRC